MIKHLNISISGRVQGVFFREFAKREAIRLGITGFVMNMSDGRLQIQAEGEENDLKEFLEWCKEGPEVAKVDSIDATEGEIIGFKKFEIKF